jgi:hypothetical protein
VPVHPYVGRPKLEWKRAEFGFEAYIVRNAKYRSSSSYLTREIFAYVRDKDSGTLLPLFEDDDASRKWLVLRRSFGDIKSFDTQREAKLHVEAMFALEYTD